MDVDLYDKKLGLYFVVLNLNLLVIFPGTPCKLLYTINRYNLPHNNISSSPNSEKIRN